jgi:hypothetical protein
VQEYTLRDSRHSVAVRMLQAGYNVMEIAEQLGNSPGVRLLCSEDGVPRSAASREAFPGVVKQPVQQTQKRPSG